LVIACTGNIQQAMIPVDEGIVMGHGGWWMGMGLAGWGEHEIETPFFGGEMQRRRR
jgi:hypothetical protein